MAKKITKPSTKLYFKQFTDEQMAEILGHADKGNIPSYLEVIIHNQSILDNELHKIRTELAKMARGSNRPILTKQSGRTVELPKIEVAPKPQETPDTRPTLQIHEEKTAEALRRARGGGR